MCRCSPYRDDLRSRSDSYYTRWAFGKLKQDIRLLKSDIAFISLRIFYSEGKVIRVLVVLVFTSNVAAIIPLAKIVYGQMGVVASLPQGEGENYESLRSTFGCSMNPPKDMYKIFIPDTVLQTVLLGLVLWAAGDFWRFRKTSVVMTRILREYDYGILFHDVHTERPTVKGCSSWLPSVGDFFIRNRCSTLWFLIRYITVLCHRRILFKRGGKRTALIGLQITLRLIRLRSLFQLCTRGNIVYYRKINMPNWDSPCIGFGLQLPPLPCPG